MVRWLARWVWTTVLLLVSLPTLAGATVLFHDTWYDGAQVAVQLGNCPGECDAVILEPDSYPFDVNYVYAIAGPDGATISFDIKILGVDGLYPDMDDVLGGADDVEINLPTAYWFEVDLAALGTPAQIDSGKFAVAFCFNAQNNPCGAWGLGSDGGPPVIPDGGAIWLDPLQGCGGGVCFGGGGDYQWANLSSFAPRNFIIRAADAQWEPGQPTDDDDDTTATDDDDDTTATDDDDTTAADDDDDDVPVQIFGIDPAQITAGDQLGFLVDGQGFQDGADLFIGALRVMPIDVESDTQIEGVFPDGLDEGLYNVCVENPDSSEDCLLNGLEVITASGCDSCAVGRARTGGAAALLGLLIAVLLRRRR